MLKGGGLRLWEARWAFVRGMRKGIPKGFSPFGNRSTLPVSAWGPDMPRIQT
jgi:hypothetical protein